MKSRKNKHFRQLLAATLAVSSSLGMISPVLAQTAAGSEIKNTATATFKDDTGQEYNSTSNEVVITVEEVAGISITAQTPSVTNPNSGDPFFVDFVITNTGNDATQFFIPGTATLNTTTAGAFTINGQLQIVAVNGNNISAVNIPEAGDTTGNLLGANGSIAPNLGVPNAGTITVRVPVKATNAAVQGNTLTVSLGDTATPNTDNQDQAADVDTNDVYTQDNPDGVGETTGVPSNGVREAMKTSSTITVAARQQAFAAVLKAVSSYDANSTPNVLTDDILTYGLALKVEDPTPPPSGLVVSSLYGTDIDLNGAATPRVLVSDAIPAGMQLGQTSSIVAPTGWTPVYTTSPLSVTADKANWVTARPASGITRIGFVYDATTTPIAKGTTVQGFSFAVNPLASFTGGQVANIAQVFGQSQPGISVPGTATQIVYDESGDQSSNNKLDGANPDPTTAGGTPAANGGISTGEANQTNGTDPGTYDPNVPATGDPTSSATNKGNTGDTSGENTVFTIAATPLNGPSAQPGAIGPTDNNDDFTNKSIQVPAGLSPSTPLDDAQTPPITFNNTMQNTSGGEQVISLLPTPPATPGDLLDGTKVTITDPATNTSVTYTYTTAGGFTTTAPDPVRITVPAGGSANYTVAVDLPAAPQLVGYPVPITAFVDKDNDDVVDADEPGNTTIDRVYTNYLRLEKKARMLEAGGTPVAGTAGTFTTDQTALAAAATPGRIIEYQITYTNISTVAAGSNNVTLAAKDLVITEDGNAGNNTWFATTTDPAYPTTGGDGSALSSGGNIDVTPNSGDIEIYTNSITEVLPQGNGTFTFQRKIK